MISERERPCAAAVLKLDLGAEVDWLLRTVTSLNSPVVFSHNDVNTGNILVRYHAIIASENQKLICLFYAGTIITSIVTMLS